MKNSPLLLVTLLSAVSLSAQTASSAPGKRLGFSFQPSKAATVAVAPTSSAAETNAVVTDAPKKDLPVTGETLLMPRFSVELPRLRLDDEKLLTDAAVVRAAEEKYLNPVYRVTIGPLVAAAALLYNPLGGWNPNAPEAMLLYEQDRRLRKVREVDDLINLVHLSDPKEAKELNRLRTSTFEGPLRPHAFPPGKH